MESPGSIEYDYVFGFPITWGSLPYLKLKHTVARVRSNGEGGRATKEVIVETLATKQKVKPDVAHGSERGVKCGVLNRRSLNLVSNGGPYAASLIAPRVDSFVRLI